MTHRQTTPTRPAATDAPASEILILADGRVLAHMLTPEFARLLSELNPDDAQFQPRSGASRKPVQS